ncbi:LANO_0E16248g1_1 [Lachancea nothofagi CBS 11611]|uniref:phosphoserine phosphatase n=1 Tax=Lachancea nothofagi CBS 11611 TaxID=1266666 RepID=A0A1G4K1U2_9SACH|nr:LANO_0E16248g1_1 [Lachancea nothofagi CBS 11611]
MVAEIVVTVIGRGPTLSQELKDEICTLLNALEDVKIESESVLSVRAQDYFLTTSKDASSIRKLVDSFNVDGADIVAQENSKFRKEKGLVVFDMDSTLIYQEVIELIAAYAQVEDRVAEITERAMNNELDFKQSLTERVKLLKGIKTATLYDEIKAKLRVTKGVPELCRGLKKTGCKLAVLSGGFTPFANYMRDNLELDYARANVLATETDSQSQVEVLSGYTLGDVVDGECKAETLLNLAREYGVSVESTVMVGDGGNDLPAMAVAGFGIAWNAKPKVQQAAPSKLNTESLQDAFYIFGYTDDEIAELLK